MNDSICEVEKLLQKMCLGYYFTEQQAIKTKTLYYDDAGRECEKESIEIVEVKRYASPDVVAIIFWLVNRRPEVWKMEASLLDILEHQKLSSGINE